MCRCTILLYQPFIIRNVEIILDLKNLLYYGNSECNERLFITFSCFLPLKIPVPYCFFQGEVMILVPAMHHQTVNFRLQNSKPRYPPSHDPTIWWGRITKPPICFAVVINEDLLCQDCSGLNFSKTVVQLQMKDLARCGPPSTKVAEKEATAILRTQC